MPSIQEKDEFSKSEVEINPIPNNSDTILKNQND